MTQVMTTIPDLGDGKKDAGKPVWNGSEHGAKKPCFMAIKMI